MVVVHRGVSSSVVVVMVGRHRFAAKRVVGLSGRRIIADVCRLVAPIRPLLLQRAPTWIRIVRVAIGAQVLRLRWSRVESARFRLPIRVVRVAALQRVSLLGLKRRSIRTLRVIHRGIHVLAFRFISIVWQRLRRRLNVVLARLCCVRSKSTSAPAEVGHRALVGRPIRGQLGFYQVDTIANTRESRKLAHLVRRTASIGCRLINNVRMIHVAVSRIRMHVVVIALGASIRIGRRIGGAPVRASNLGIVSWRLASPILI